jgi:poly(hydroxyalkanoate) granule-associated protein
MPMTTEKETLNNIAEDKGTLEMLQEGITKTSREIWLAGLGVFATIDKEGTKLFNKFVERGREFAKGEKTVKTNGEPSPTYLSERKDQFTHEIFSKLEGAAGYVRRKINEISASTPNVSRDEVKALTAKVDKLTEAVAALVQKMDEGTKTGTKKAAL